MSDLEMPRLEKFNLLMLYESGILRLDNGSYDMGAIQRMHWAAYVYLKEKNVDGRWAKVTMSKVEGIERLRLLAAHIRVYST